MRIKVINEIGRTLLVKCEQSGGELVERNAMLEFDPNEVEIVISNPFGSSMDAVLVDHGRTASFDIKE